MSAELAPGDWVRVSGTVGKGVALEGGILEMKLPSGRWLVRLSDRSVYSIPDDCISLARRGGKPE